MVQNVPPTEAWSALQDNAQAQLVDVRTDAEWAYVGFPDLTAAGKWPVMISWQVFPAMQVDPGFVDALRGAGFAPEHHIYFLCRSGVRSLHAAKAAIQAGFPHAYNIADGFEGPPDEDGHRGTVSGWKVAGLPWTQR
jgi:rhodanese-related sulfurtransferase